MNNYAYVTLLSSLDYLATVLILNRNFQELNCTYPLYIAVTEEIYHEVQKYQERESLNLIPITTLTYSEQTRQSTPSTRLLNIASKLNVLTLYQFDKIVYIDADSFFVQTPDILFTFPDGAMLEEPNETMGFAGLFVCCPQNHNLKYYLDILKEEFVWESDLLGALWFPFKTNKDYRIPGHFFFNIRRGDFSLYYPLNHKIYGIHFCSHLKPWLCDKRTYKQNFPFFDATRDEIIQFYYTHYIEPLQKDYPELFA